jgi:RHS repeat-associated protein
VAELDNANNIASRFVYTTSENVPEYMVRDGITYRLVKDHLGSIRLVVNVQSSTIAQQMDYDEYGNVMMDTNPGFTPFGFAGGIYDSRIGLVRFGLRDYNATIGRWNVKDPIIFRSSQSNLYQYCASDPINLIDPSGKFSSRAIGMAYFQGALAFFSTWMNTGDVQKSIVAAGIGMVSGFIGGGLEMESTLGRVVVSLIRGVATNIATQYAVNGPSTRLNETSVALSALASITMSGYSISTDLAESALMMTLYISIQQVLINRAINISQ